MLSACLLFAACKENNEEPYRMSYCDKALLSSGDIIMRRGKGLLSTIIVNSLNDSTGVSHCGIIVRDGDSISVIHCLSDDVSDVDGVQTCSLDDFVDESIRGTVSVVRCKVDTCGYLVDRARYYLKLHKRFDRKFDSSDTTRFFCSEMPVHIINNTLHINISEGKQQYSFSMFFNPQYFETILTHK